MMKIFICAMFLELLVFHIVEYIERTRCFKYICGETINSEYFFNYCS